MGKDMGLKCESIPSKGLEEQHSLDKFKQCGSMSSTEGCGAEDIRRSIQSLCQQCDGQAGGEVAAKAALKAKCDAILASAPAPPIQRLYSGSTSTAMGIPPLHSVGGMPPFAFVLVVVAVSLGKLVFTFRSRHHILLQHAGEEQLTSRDAVAEECDEAGVLVSSFTRP